MIERPVMKTIREFLDLDKEITTFQSREKVLTVALFTEKAYDCRALTEKFISEEKMKLKAKVENKDQEFSTEIDAIWKLQELIERLEEPPQAFLWVGKISYLLEILRIVSM